MRHNIEKIIDLVSKDQSTCVKRGLTELFFSYFMLSGRLVGFACEMEETTTFLLDKMV